MEFDLVQISSLGLGAVLAIIVLNWKRGDDARYAEALKALVDEGNRRFDMMLEAFRANTEALSQLREAIEGMQDTDRLMSMVEDRIRAGTGPLRSPADGD
jgi:hypothetical protein